MRCRTPLCTTLLSRYNLGIYCAVCERRRTTARLIADGRRAFFPRGKGSKGVLATGLIERGDVVLV